MDPIDFPTTPANGDEYIANGKTWTYESSIPAWVPKPTPFASQAEMEAGTEIAPRVMSPLRVKQAVAALADAEVNTANVTAAGALMDSEVENLAAVKAFDPSDYATAAQGTDARMPIAHKSTHATGGSDALIPSDIGALENTNTAVNAAIAEDPAATREALKSANSETWVFEGDSWTAGTAQGNDRETWPYYIARFAPKNVSFVNVALAGTTAQTMVSTFAAQVAPNLTATTGNATTCFIFAGINDVATPRTITQVRDDLRSLWTSARNAGARVVAFTLPHRTAVGGWSQSDWLAINTQIIADSGYYDVLVRSDIVFPNTSSGEFSDGLHVFTAAHQKFASRIMDALTGRQVMPSIIPDMVCNAISSVTLAANTRRNLPFATFSYQTGGDYSLETVGGDANTTVFTCPVDGTYEIYAEVCMSGLSSGDTVFMNCWITPLATGVEVEHRLDYQVASGANPTIRGFIRRRLLRGDKFNISVQTNRAGASMLTNANNADFTARLVSIP